jgi:hypothetical protein
MRERNGNERVRDRMGWDGMEEGSDDAVVAE